MSHFTHEGTDALKRLAEEVERERATKGHTPFDEVIDEASRDDAEAVQREHAEDAKSGTVNRSVTSQMPH
jgi:hypothetical protein